MEGNRWRPIKGVKVFDKNMRQLGTLTGVASRCTMAGCTGVRWHFKNVRCTRRPCCKSLIEIIHDGQPALQYA